MNKKAIRKEGDWYLVEIDTPSACSDTSLVWVHKRNVLPTPCLCELENKENSND